MNAVRLAGIAIAIAMTAKAAAVERYMPAIAAGTLADPALREISGIAASSHHNDRYWVHNDSGDGAFLYAIDVRGRRIGTAAIDGVLALDWEDIAAFERDGKPYLLIGDIGDNLKIRPEYELLAIEEPDLLPGDGTIVHLRPAWRVRFAYDSGPHDAETLAVDAAHDAVWLIPKFIEPMTVFRLPLHPADDRVQTPQRLAELAPPLNLPAKPKFRPTSFDLSSDGRRTIVLGYRSAWVYRRDDGKSWAEAFTHAPEVLSTTAVRQPEAATFARDGRTLVITGEGVGATMLKIETTKR